jgi:hypothetical protein
LPLPSVSTPEYAQIDSRASRSQHLLKPPTWRSPDWLDYLLFFGALPAGIAFLFSLVGIRLINGMPYWQGLIYMLIHMAIAWWSVSIGAGVIKFTFRSWRPPSIAICTVGYFLALIPAGFMYQRLGDFYSAISPVFAANRVDAAMPSWHLDYLLHFIRYSIPALPLFLAGVFGYRFITGVNWFGYQRIARPVTAEAYSPDVSAVSEVPAQTAVAALIEGTRLPNNAVLLGIKAEQHYIKIWSDQGNDLVRYRFKDLEVALGRCNGLQVHRSWWVNLDQVRQFRNDGRKLELVINDDLSVPVSMSCKNAVYGKLGKRVAISDDKTTKN